ncbi:hypothetical protein, partial [Chloroflexus sp.]
SMKGYYYSLQGKRYDTHLTVRTVSVASRLLPNHAHAPIERERFSFQHTIAPWMDEKSFWLPPV